ncbi:hypothetical protein [Aliihoeflea sp. 40Bstr573]|uniref:hypothetical protein n=1 Tax=Aliihoeflea sp. 40Bstr573 TaxID=2696467 RepID=UPI00209595CB|nr:hypothetical protein [Aliihoeflea sp. 40Bstr573]MCO6385426.1 hypothetical protein [Aliihoeflea sp. 40Bstr573]
MSLLGFDAMAGKRGDGLHPVLRDLLERRQALETDSRIADLAGMRGQIVQAGPNPTPAPGAFRPGNVIDFKLRAAELALDVENSKAAKGTA